MTGYMSSTAPAPVSLPLKKCNYGTILQVSYMVLCYLFLGVRFKTISGDVPGLLRYSRKLRQ